MQDPIVGIDLGTSNSVVAHADDAGVVKVLADDSGYKIHPSVVSFHPNGGVIVGAAAKQRKVIDPSNTIYSAKRLIGRSFRSPQVQTAMTRVPYKIKEGANQAPLISTRGGDFAIPEISAIVLDHMRNIATARLETQVSRAIVTVPASFNDAQRSATATAGAIAGLAVVRVLNEPTAAALAYGHTRNLREVIAVYDFGGGTFDISLLRLDGQVYEVVGTSGDTFLGGDDLDERIVDKMVERFLAEHRIDLRTNEVAMMRLRAVAEQTKIELSRRNRAVVRIDEIAYGPRGAPLNLQIEVTRDEFVRLVSDIIDRTFPVCREALALAGIGIESINDVILVGGTTKIPYVRDQVSRFFARAPRTDVNPEDAVAIGAALQARALGRVLGRPSKSQPLAIATPSTGVQSPSDSFTDEPSASDSYTEVGPGPQEAADPISGGVMMAPTDELVTGRPKRETAGYGAPRSGEKPDTSYSITRTSTRDKLEKAAPVTAPEPPAHELAPKAVLGRMQTRPAIPRIPTSEVPKVPSAPVAKKTAFGVPAAPAPPPLPRRPDSEPTAKSPESGRPIDKLIDDWIGPGDTHDNIQPAPSSTQPMAPQHPIAPPTAPTLIVQPPEPPSHDSVDSITLSQDFALEVESVTGQAVAPASTARGMGPMNTAQARSVEPLPVVAKTTAPSLPPPPQPPPPRAFPPPPLPVMPLPMPLPAPQPVMQMPQPVILEVTPRGLGIATVAGYCEELIHRNARIPTQTRKVFTTSRDNQQLVRIVVCQGESRRMDRNTVIGDLVLQGLPPRKRGETSIEVTFSLDPSGILQVRALDAQTGAEQQASLDLVGGVAHDDVAASRDRLQQLRR